MSTPKNNPKGIFRCGCFISPAIKVTLFQASLLKSEPISATPNAEQSAPRLVSPEADRKGREIFCDQCEAEEVAQRPKMIKPASESILVLVNIFWMILPLLMPRLLRKLRKKMEDTARMPVVLRENPPIVKRIFFSSKKGKSTPINRAKATATAAITPVCITVKTVHP